LNWKGWQNIRTIFSATREEIKRNKEKILKLAENKRKIKI
jgi:hypothetical protein